MFRDPAYEVGRGGAQHPANVVSETHCGSTQSGREELAGNHREAAEVAGAKKSNQWSDEKQRIWIAHERKERHQQGGHDKKANVGVLAAEAVCQISKRDIAQKRAGLHDDRPPGGLNNAEATATLRDRHGKKTR